MRSRSYWTRCDVTRREAKRIARIAAARIIETGLVCGDWLAWEDMDVYGAGLEDPRMEDRQKIEREMEDIVAALNSAADRLK